MTDVAGATAILDDLTGPVLVACSGGPDSLALLVLAAEQGRLGPTAVHVDHGLRPGSAAEARTVEDAATRLGAGFRAARIEVGPGGNLEARAREARYATLEAIRAEIGATTVLVGHTADDQAETVLLNLLRGSGRAGLGGMPERRGAIVRPLLGVRRSDTLAICERAGLTPLHDPMNDDVAFRRVWLRQEVLPLLSRGAERDLVPVLARQASVLRAESDLLDRLAAAAWPGSEPPAAAALTALDPALARRAVRMWLGAPPPSLDEVEAVLSVARHERRAVDLAGGRRVARRGGVLRREEHRLPCRPPAVAPAAVPGRVST
jgi:tRNA(Ile)-lysidine synthase